MKHPLRSAFFVSLCCAGSFLISLTASAKETAPAGISGSETEEGISAKGGSKSPHGFDPVDPERPSVLSFKAVSDGVETAVNRVYLFENDTSFFSTILVSFSIGKYQGAFCGNGCFDLPFDIYYLLESAFVREFLHVIRPYGNYIIVLLFLKKSRPQKLS